MNDCFIVLLVIYLMVLHAQLSNLIIWSVKVYFYFDLKVQLKISFDIHFPFLHLKEEPLNV